MPWSIEEKNGRFCVVKEGGKEVKCYPTHAEATKLLKALYANVKDFSSELTPTGHKDFTGKIFEVGIFMDKDFSLSLEEMADAVAEFTPVDIDIEHKNTIFDGKLGKLETIELGDDDFTNLHGTAKLPLWLSDAIGDDPIKVSCQWDTQKKRLTKLSLVKDPRIEDAKLSAAFAKSEDSTKEKTMPELDEETRKGFLSVLADFFKGPEAPPIPKAAEIPKIAETPPPPVSPTVAEFNALKAEMETVKAQALKAVAEAWADSKITSGFAVPAEREKMIAAFSIAQKADIAAGVANFSGEGGESTKAIDALYSEKRHSFFAEEMPSDLKFLDSTPDLSKIDDEEAKKMLRDTVLGRAILAAEGK